MDFNSNHSNPTIVRIIASAVFALVLLVFGIFFVSVRNNQYRLANLYEAKVTANKTELSNLKSKLPEAASVTDAQMRKLEELFSSYADSRTPESRGALMQWTTEAVPNVDQSTYLNLQNVITASRDAWTARQKELVDVAREFNTNLDTFPSSVVLRMSGNFQKLNPHIVVSGSTEEAFRTGRDEPLILFPNASSEVE